MQLILFVALLALIASGNGFTGLGRRPTSGLIRHANSFHLMSDASEGDVVPMAGAEGTMGEEMEEEESEEEKYKREKLAEIKDLQAKEVFVKVDTGNWECQACGFVYSEKDGYEKRGVPKGTAFAAVENFRCPQCGAGKKYFVQETETLSGFKENLKYGLGANSLTAGQKSNLIYGGLALAVALFLSGYLLE